MVESNSWLQSALCKKDSHPHRWLSSNIDDINYAKNVCRKCTVRMECLVSAIYEREEFIGVNGGLSEIEYLMSIWKEAESEQESNWDISDRTIQRLLREIA